MARFTMVYKVKDAVELYLESEGDENYVDEVHGDGYLAFWTRCREAIMDYEKENPNARGMGYASIDDLYEGTTKEIW